MNNELMKYGDLIERLPEPIGQVLDIVKSHLPSDTVFDLTERIIENHGDHFSKIYISHEEIGFRFNGFFMVEGDKYIPLNSTQVIGLNYLDIIREDVPQEEIDSINIKELDYRNLPIQSDRKDIFGLIYGFRQLFAVEFEFHEYCDGLRSDIIGDFIDNKELKKHFRRLPLPNDFDNSRGTDVDLYCAVYSKEDIALHRRLWAYYIPNAPREPMFDSKMDRLFNFLDDIGYNYQEDPIWKNSNPQNERDVANIISQIVSERGLLNTDQDQIFPQDHNLLTGE